MPPNPLTLVRRAYEAGFEHARAGNVDEAYRDFMYDQWLATQKLSEPI